MDTIAGTDSEETGTVTKVDCSLVVVNAGTVETIGSSPVEVEAVEAADDTVACSSTEVEVVAETVCCPSVEEQALKMLVRSTRPSMMSVGKAMIAPPHTVYWTDAGTWVE